LLAGLILDLRGNPGGLLTEAVNISNLFVGRGHDIVYTRGKLEEWNKTYKAINAAEDDSLPLVILVNGGSASASEIVAGSLQDFDRAVLMGQRTFGKGLVQTTRVLSYNAQVKITTSRYYIPSGRCIQAVNYSERDANGIAIRIPDSLRKAFTTQSGRKVYDGGGLVPDVTTDPPEVASPVAALLSRNMILTMPPCIANDTLKSLLRWGYTWARPTLLISWPSSIPRRSHSAQA
jgi:carboxyl-terminal processing protease